MVQKGTGFFDCHGVEIGLGDKVKDPEGFVGTVVFKNGAYRYDIQNGIYLRFNSSLLYKEKFGTEKFEIVKKFEEKKSEEVKRYTEE